MKTENLVVGNMADPVLLNKIDKLFASGVGDYISLPQLIVVGDQSSGKSSVLEGLTNLPFPRDSGLCTRFATQITFRRAQFANISVSIIPGKSASGDHIEEVTNWGKSDLQELNAKSFAEIMTEAHTLMGLSNKDNKGDRGTFSEDILRLEICGPEQEHFSVVDVPGIFRKTTAGMTTNADKEMVRAMVRRYMDNPRSIMLTVIPANVDIATQEILTMAEEADKDGHRTLGVLTKPDLVDSGAEARVMDLVKGENHKLNLGWCLVRNLGQKQLHSSSADRDANEMVFFRDKAPWNTLDKDRVGIGALRIQLQEILASNIRREFPKVKSEIHSKLTASRQALAKLGGKRETPAEQSRYLLDMSMRFQEIAASALSANYVGSDWFDYHHSLRFATAVVNRNDVFSKMLEQYGHSYAFNDAPTMDSLWPASSSEESATIEDEEVEKEDRKIRVRSLGDFIDLEELKSSQETVREETRKDILVWLTSVYRMSRGFELGTFDSSLLAMTMKTQSSNWEPIAMGYIKDVINMAHKFISDLLELICPDQRVRDGLMSVLVDELSNKYQDALKHVRFLLYVERTGTPATLNHYFNDNLEKSRQKRMRLNIQEKLLTDSKHGLVVRLDDIIHTHPMSNVEHVVQEIHDILSSYYKVARKRFADNLCMQGADYYLVTGPFSPLKLFSPAFVSRLSEEQLVEIAGEDAALKRKRTALNKEIADLDAGKTVLS